MDELLKEIVTHLQIKMDETGRSMTVEVETNGDLPALRADHDGITKVMINLVDNAFSYTPENGLIRLKAEYLSTTREVELTVADNGHGIPESIQDRIFERFFRGDEYDEIVMESAGTGLGLAIVKSLVEMHNGSIYFKSELGKGTTFYVRIPAMSEESTNPEQDQ